MQTCKLIKVGHSVMVTIPRWFLTSLRWQRGETVVVELVGNALRLTAIRPHKRDTATVFTTDQAAGAADPEDAA